MITNTTTILQAIPRTPAVVITAWLELEEYIDTQAANYDRRALVLTSELMDLWHCDQSTVSRRLSAFKKAGLATITRANGYQGGWWVGR